MKCCVHTHNQHVPSTSRHKKAEVGRELVSRLASAWVSSGADVACVPLAERAQRGPEAVKRPTASGASAKLLSRVLLPDVARMSADILPRREGFLGCLVITLIEGRFRYARISSGREHSRACEG